MEIFVDGGLFEIGIVTALAYTINYIFMRKYLLIIYSAIAILSPVGLIFFRTGEFFYWFITMNFINGALLVILLWKLRQKFPQQTLFDVSKFSKKLYGKIIRKL